jgi:hypothetical protein
MTITTYVYGGNTYTYDSVTGKTVAGSQVSTVPSVDTNLTPNLSKTSLTQFGINSSSSSNQSSSSPTTYNPKIVNLPGIGYVPVVPPITTPSPDLTKTKLPGIGYVTPKPVTPITNPSPDLTKMKLPGIGYVTPSKGTVPIISSTTKTNPIDLKIAQTQTQWKQFESEYQSKIVNGQFIGTDNEWEAYQKKFNELSQIDAQNDVEFNKYYRQVGDGTYVDREYFDSLSPEYQAILRKSGTKALEAKLDADYKKLPDGSLIKRTDYANLTSEQKKIADTKGYDTLITKIDADQRVQDSALSKLDKYKDKDGNYDLSTYLLDAKSPAEGLQTLREAGFTQEDITSTTKFNNDVANQNREYIREIYSPQNIAKNVGIMAAEMVVPGLGTARNWNTMSVGAKTLSIAMDIAMIVPFVGEAAAGARLVGTASRTERFLAALRGARPAGEKALQGGLRQAAIDQIRSPITVILHPVSTVKGTVSGIRNIAEDILHPSKIPVGVLSTSDNTVRMIVTENTTRQELMSAREKIMDQVIKSGGKVTPEVEVGGIKYKLSVAPLMKETKGLAHASPDIGVFEEGSKVLTKAGKPANEQGWFLANQPLARFSRGSAFGGIVKAPLPANANHAVLEVSKFRAGELVQIDKTPIRKLNFTDAKNIPQDLAKDIQTYAENNNARLYGSLNDWIKLDKAKVPNDIDLAFTNKDKAVKDILNIAKKNGYDVKPNIEGNGYLVGKTNKFIDSAIYDSKDSKWWVKLGDIDSIEHHTGIIGDLAQKGQKVKGIQVETLGEQYLRQSLASVAKTPNALAKAKARGQKLKIAAPEVRKLLQQANAHKVKPGFYITSQDTALKAVATNKIYPAHGLEFVEMERKLVVNADIAKPVQNLFTRVNGERTEIFLEKALTRTQITKLKMQGLIEDIKAPFKPAITMESLDDTQMAKLNNILKQSGNTSAANNLRRTNTILSARSAGRITSVKQALDRIGTRIDEPRTVANYRSRSNPRGQVRVVVAQPRLSNRISSTRQGSSRISNKIASRVGNTRISNSTSRINNTRKTNTTTKVNRINPPRNTEPPRAAKPPVRVEPPIRIEPPKVRVPRFGKGLKYPIVNINIDSNKQKQKLKDFEGSIVWRQGFGWWAIKAPYKSKSDVAFFYHEPPPNAQNVKGGVGSALRSIQTITGKPPHKLTIDLGIQDIVIERGSTISYKRDIKNKTHGDIKIKGISVSQVRQIKNKVNKHKNNNNSDYFGNSF